LLDFPNYNFSLSEKEIRYWDMIIKLREEFLKAIEIARKDKKIINTSLEAEIKVKAGEEISSYLKDTDFWRYFLIVASFEHNGVAEAKEEVVFVSEEIKGLEIIVKKTSWKKCERCWQRTPEVGTLENPSLCKRCLDVIKSLQV